MEVPTELVVNAYKVRMTLTEDMLGTCPKDPEVYRAYIESKRPDNVPEEDEAATVEKIEEKGWTGFHADETGLFIYDYAIRGFIKEAANNLKDTLVKKEGYKTAAKNLRSKVDRWLFVGPRRIYLCNADGTPKTKPDGVLERPLRAMTAKGPRVTLVRSDSVAAGTILEADLFDVNGMFKPKLLNALLWYGALQGLGQFRNGSYGRFTFELEPLEVKA